MFWPLLQYMRKRQWNRRRREGGNGGRKKKREKRRRRGIKNLFTVLSLP